MRVEKIGKVFESLFEPLNEPGTLTYLILEAYFPHRFCPIDLIEGDSSFLEVGSTDR